jgi:predicted transposase YbfD/YdcC
MAGHRQGTPDGQEFDCMSYYLSSLCADAMTFSCGIRGHRQSENGLHWVKDVVFGEDAARCSAFNAATNWSIVRHIVINLLRSNGYRSLTTALRFIRHDIERLFTLMRIN